MTKRLTIALVAVALFVLMAIMPVSAAPNGTQIQQGAFVFIGEGGLNLTQTLNQALNPQVAPNLTISKTPAAGDLKIGWWASAAQITTTAPTKTIDLSGRYTNFEVAQADFVGFTGNWYLLSNTSANAAFLIGGTTPSAVFNVQDPTLSIAVWDFSQSGTDVTGKSVPQGEHLGFQINTNMYSATLASRNNTVISWAQPSLGAFDKTTYTTMPDGEVSIWNMNGTPATMPRQAYGTFIEYNYGQADANIWRVTNYTSYAKMTWASADNSTGIFGTGRVAYWNNNAIPTATAAEATASAARPFSYRNFTDNADGTMSNTATFGSAVATTNAGAPTKATDGFITLKVKTRMAQRMTNCLLVKRMYRPISSTSLSLSNSWMSSRSTSVLQPMQQTMQQNPDTGSLTQLTSTTSTYTRLEPTLHGQSPLLTR